MRGEELQGLNIEELQQLEKALEAGLSRVIGTKVVFYLLIADVKSSTTVWYNVQDFSKLTDM